MKNRRIRSVLILAANLVILLSTLVITACYTARGIGSVLDRPWEPADFSYYRYYTTLSNIFAAVAAIPTVVFAVRRIAGGKNGIPRWAVLLRFSSTSMLTVTMMTVLCFLGLLYGYRSMYAGLNFWYHLVNPVLAILSFVLWEADSPLTKKAVLFGVLPTLLYGIVYVSMTVVLGPDRGGWPDFYGFNMGGFWYISVSVILFANLVFSGLLLLIRRKTAERIGSE